MSDQNPFLKFKAEHFLDINVSVNSKNRYSGKEDDFQITCATFLQLEENIFGKPLNWFHVANERKTNSKANKSGGYFTFEGNLLKRKGVKKGVSDIWIMTPNKDYSGLIIELKTKYNKPTEEQNEWLSNLNDSGYLAVWVNSIDEFMAVTEFYFRNIEKKS